MDSVMGCLRSADPHLFPRELLKANLEVPNREALASSLIRLGRREAGKGRYSS